MNILFIMADDQGSWAMNCGGTKELCTPNLNRIAESGMQFKIFIVYRRSALRQELLYLLVIFLLLMVYMTGYEVEILIKISLKRQAEKIRTGMGIPVKTNLFLI